MVKGMKEVFPPGATSADKAQMVKVHVMLLCTSQRWQWQKVMMSRTVGWILPQLGGNVCRVRLSLPLVAAGEPQLLWKWSRWGGGCTSGWGWDCPSVCHGWGRGEVSRGSSRCSPAMLVLGEAGGSLYLSGNTGTKKGFFSAGIYWWHPHFSLFFLSNKCHLSHRQMSQPEH